MSVVSRGLPAFSQSRVTQHTLPPLRCRNAASLIDGGTSSISIDGSHHPWLEDRGPKLTLLIAVDDATGVVAQAVFRTSEVTRGYLVLLEGLIRQRGILTRSIATFWLLLVLSWQVLMQPFDAARAVYCGVNLSDIVFC